MKNSNQINVPQAREAMDKFKMAAAQDVDGPVTYWTAIDLSQIIKSTDGFPKSIAALLLHLYKQIGVDLQYKGLSQNDLSKSFEAAPRLAQAKEKATNYTQKTVHKTREAKFASQKVYCFSFYALCRPRNKQVVSQPACLYFMVQFQYVKSHTYKTPFHHNVGAASGQEAAEVHVFLDHGEYALRLDGAVDPE